VCKRAALSFQNDENSSEHKCCGGCRFRNADGAAGHCAPRLAEMTCPDGEVGLVDPAVAVAVGGEMVVGAAERVAPDGEVGGVDDKVLVKVA
jgi:hypothetical protein